MGNFQLWTPIFVFKLLATENVLKLWLSKGRIFKFFLQLCSLCEAFKKKKMLLIKLGKIQWNEFKNAQIFYITVCFMIYYKYSTSDSRLHKVGSISPQISWDTIRNERSELISSLVQENYINNLFWKFVSQLKISQNFLITFSDKISLTLWHWRSELLVNCPLVTGWFFFFVKFYYFI